VIASEEATYPDKVLWALACVDEVLAVVIPELRCALTGKRAEVA
jgi:hypothetical protein